MGQLISGLSLRPGDALVPELGFDLESKFPCLCGCNRVLNHY